VSGVFNKLQILWSI